MNRFFKVADISLSNIAEAFEILTCNNHPGGKRHPTEVANGVPQINEDLMVAKYPPWRNAIQP